MKRLFFLMLFFPCSILAQSVVYDIEPQIVKTQQKYAEAWRRVEKMKFFVIQVSSFTGERAAERAQEMVENLNTLLEEMSMVKAYSVFEEPNFRVRVGNFVRRVDAGRVLVLIQNQVPGVFITTEVRRIRDVIEK